MTPKQIIERAINRIEAGWCKGVAAQDENEIILEPWDERACQWCLMGSIGVNDEFVADEENATVVIDMVVHELNDRYGDDEYFVSEIEDVIRWNDKEHRVKGDVISVLQSVKEKIGAG